MKKIRQINYSAISLATKLISRNFYQKRMRVFFSNFHTSVWKNEKFTLTEKISRQTNYLVKTLLSRNFGQKSVSVNFRNFQTVTQYTVQNA